MLQLWVNNFGFVIPNYTLKLVVLLPIVHIILMSPVLSLNLFDLFNHLGAVN